MENVDNRVDVTLLTHWERIDSYLNKILGMKPFSMMINVGDRIKNSFCSISRIYPRW